MKKVMISQPMRGLEEEKVLATREKATKVLNSMGYEVIDTYIDNERHPFKDLKGLGVTNPYLYFLGCTIGKMGKCNAVYFCKGWEYARGCRIEHEAATAYGLELLYE